MKIIHAMVEFSHNDVHFRLQLPGSVGATILAAAAAMAAGTMKMSAAAVISSRWLVGYFTAILEWLQSKTEADA